MFDSIPGQRRPKAFFEAALRRGLSHSYLLAGPEGVGMREFALDLGRALVTACGGCGHCDECARVERGVHPDLTVIEREGEFIRIDQIAELIADLSLRPFSSTRRVWIIMQPERLNVEAANTFLKSLEEPPEHVHFILVSDAPDAVLETIVSRCQTVDFGPVADDELAAHLVAHPIGDVPLDAERAAVIARLARGSLERARRLVDDEAGPHLRQRYLGFAARLAQHEREAEREFVEAVANAETATATRIEKDYAKRRRELERSVPDERERAWYARRLDAQLKRQQAREARLAALDALDHLTGWLRDVWAAGLGAGDAVWNRDRRDDLAAAGVARPELYARLIEVVDRTRKDLSLNVDRGLALQAMFARFQEVWHSA